MLGAVYVPGFNVKNEGSLWLAAVFWIGSLDR
jgi:hypothetical protein